MKEKLNKEKYVGKENKTFCMAPWIHMHYMPTGEVLPCCVWPYTEPVGNVNNDSIYDIWNNNNYKFIRTQMLEGILPSGCKNCAEKDSVGAHSMRKHMNFNFAHLFDNMMDRTEGDGSLSDFKMAYFDVRFSNICNFKCRGCSPALSSAWLDDHEKLHSYKSDNSKYVQIFPNPKFEKEIIDLIPSVEEAYFAGGEPLLMREHYQILDELIRLNKTDVRLAYNTNMSTLKFKGKSIVDYWSKFKNLFIGVSIDDYGERGEYFRKGMNWDETVTNIQFIKTNCPHALLSVNCTVNIMNIFNLFSLHAKLVELKLINPLHFSINLMLDPEEYSVQVLPSKMKVVVEHKFEEYLEVCAVKFPSISKDLRAMFSTVIKYMNAQDRSCLFDKFLERTEKLDLIRNENFREIYSEFSNS